MPENGFVLMNERTLYEYVGGGRDLGDVSAGTDGVLSLVVGRHLVNDQWVNTTIRAWLQTNILTHYHLHATV